MTFLPGGTIDTSPSSLRTFAILVMGLVWVYIFFHSKPVRDYNAGRLTGEWTTQVKKPVHPEMQGVKPGEELMGVTFNEPKTECSLEEYKDLQARIEILRAELGGEEEDEDDDDDGGDIVALRR